MKLFLASEAKHQDSLEKLGEFVGGFEDKKIIYIPTATNGAMNYSEWRENSGSWKVVQNLSSKVEAVELEDFRDGGIREKLIGSDIIWFAGGMCGYLMYWVRRCELDKHIKEILNNGTIYVGSSAGSMVTSPDLSVIDTISYENEYGASAIPSMNLVDFWIYPHFEDEMIDDIKSKWNGGDLYLLKNGESITVDGGKIEVFGEERIVKGEL